VRAAGQAGAPAAPGDDDLGLLLLIREFEQAVLRLFAEAKVPGTTHTCLGQEYIPVAMNPLLQPAFVVSNHRGHGHYLAQFRDPAGLLAELTGRAGGVSGGRGGSQHLYRPGFCSTGVQGEGVGVAAGIALHIKTRRAGNAPGQPDLAVAYIGDGTWGQGVVYEALNMAQLWQLPLVVVVENNGIAQSTPTTRAMAGTVAGRAAAFGVRYEDVRATCLTEIRAQLAGPVAGPPGGAAPLVIEFRTQRLGPHSKGDDTRDAAELAGLRAHDWYPRYERWYPDQLRRVGDVQRQLIGEVVAEVMARPLADGEVRAGDAAGRAGL
jgi:pyruvate dehydrogenase E1 component alpha subunit